MSKNPEIRFKDDVNDWEEKELKDVILYNEKSKFPASHASDYGRYRFYKSDNGEDVTFSDDYIVDGKNIIINDGGQFNAKFSIGKIAYSDHCISFYTNENTEEEFVYQNITKNNDKINKEGFTGGALKNIDREYFNNFKISIPDKVQQEKISSLLSSFDKKIKLEEETIAHLKSVKASMLQKMFPKDGQKIPEIRFAGFTDDWEQHKLGDIIDKLTGGASIAPDDYVEEGYRTIPKGAVNDTGVADMSGCKCVSEAFFKKNISSKTSTGELVTSLRDLVPTAPNMGRIVRIYGDSEDFLMPQGVYSIVLKKDSDEDFLIAYSNSPDYRKIIATEKNGSTQVHIRNGEFLNIEISVPTYDEQKRIGATIKNLDNLITLHQRKYDKLIEIKQALLQKLLP